jgi:hypothetical protein
MSTIGFNQPLYMLPFEYREALQSPEVTRK